MRFALLLAALPLLADVVEHSPKNSKPSGWQVSREPISLLRLASLI
jgi:hypothetical protein